MVNSTKIFAKANMANTHKMFYTVMGFIPELRTESIEKLVGKNKIQKDILLVEEEINLEHRIIPHIESYHIYNSSILKNKANILNNLKDREIIFLNLFSTINQGVSKRIVKDKIQIEEINRESKKRGYDLFSGLNSISYYVSTLYENMKKGQKELDELLDNEHIREPIFIPIGPLVQFGVYDENKNRMYNGVNEICNDNIVDKVNNVLRSKGKKEIVTGRILENLKSNLYQANPAFYDGSLSLLLLSMEENREPTEYEIKRIRSIAGYNRWLNAILISRIMELSDQGEFYYFGTKSSNSYTIVSKASEIAGKAIYNINLVENVDLPLEGVSNKSSLNKLSGYISSINNGIRKITFRDFFG